MCLRWWKCLNENFKKMRETWERRNPPPHHHSRNAFELCQTWKIQPILLSKWCLQCIFCAFPITLICTAEGKQGQQGLSQILESFPVEFWVRGGGRGGVRDKDVATGNFPVKEHYFITASWYRRQRLAVNSTPSDCAEHLTSKWEGCICMS